MSPPRTILHVDMDAFYASVEQRDHPEYRGKPVIVGGLPGRRGVVAAASYEARRFGVHSAMPSTTAQRLCPHAIFVRPRIGDYAVVSEQIREIFHRYTPLVEPLSLDEAFLDVTGSRQLFGDGEAIARAIKQAIRSELQLVASVGVAPNKFLAKIASDLNKPDALTIVSPTGVAEFLSALPVRRLWGVGKVAETRLHNKGIETIGQLSRLTLAQLSDLFGESSGTHLYQLSQGHDERPVTPDHAAESISHETTFAEDIDRLDTLRAVLQELTDQVCRRVRRLKLAGRTVQLKIRYADFQTYTRSQTLETATSSTRALWQAAKLLLETRLPERPLEVRLLGIGVQQLQPSGRRSNTLFPEPTDERDRQLDTAIDQIVGRFGKSAMRHGTSLESDRPKDGDPPG